VWFFDGVFAGGILSFLKLGQKILFVCRSAQFYFAILENSLLFVSTEKEWFSERACVRQGILGLYSYVLHKNTVT
jgi:hypothetical protein